MGLAVLASVDARGVEVDVVGETHVERVLQRSEQTLAIFKRVDRCVQALVAACRFAVPWLNLGEKRVARTNGGGLYAREHDTGNAWLLARFGYQSEGRGGLKMSCEQYSGCVGVLRPEG